MDIETTLNQLTQSDNGYGRLVAMIGANHFCEHTEEDGDSWVSFKFMRGAKNKANFIKITLNAMDTYDVEMGKIWGANYKVVDSSRNLYCDNLFNHFQSETQLALSF